MERYEHIRAIRRRKKEMGGILNSSKVDSSKPSKKNLDDSNPDVSKLNERPGMDPNVWGPPMWDLLFTLCFKCDAPMCSETLVGLLDALEVVLPCPDCRKSYIKHRQMMQSTSSRDLSIAKWLWKIHDMVNAKLGKICISFEKLEARHKSMTCLTNDFAIVDLFAIASMSADASAIRDAFVKVIGLLAQINECHNVFFRLPRLWKQEETEPFWNNLYSTKVALYESHGMKPQTLEEFEAQYKEAIAV